MSEYFAGLRARIGHDLILSPGVTAIVLRDGGGGQEVLLAQRSDTGEWTPLCGAVDPGEDVDVAAVREIREEACVDAVVERMLSTQALPVTVYVNGDRAQYLDVSLRCRYTGGDARVGDEENRAVRWFPVDALPPLNDRFRRTIQLACEPDGPLLFGAAERPIG